MSGVYFQQMPNKSKTRLRNARPRVNHGFFDLWSRVYTADKDSETNIEQTLLGGKISLRERSRWWWDCHLYPLEWLCNKYSNELTHVDPVLTHWSTKMFRKGSWISLSAVSKTWMSPRSAKIGSAVEPHGLHHNITELRSGVAIGQQHHRSQDQGCGEHNIHHLPMDHSPNAEKLMPETGFWSWRRDEKTTKMWPKMWEMERSCKMRPKMLMA